GWKPGRRASSTPSPYSDRVGVWRRPRERNRSSPTSSSPTFNSARPVAAGSSATLRSDISSILQPGQSCLWKSTSSRGWLVMAAWNSSADRACSVFMVRCPSGRGAGSAGNGQDLVGPAPDCPGIPVAMGHLLDLQRRQAGVDEGGHAAYRTTVVLLAPLRFAGAEHGDARRHADGLHQLGDEALHLRRG